MQATNFASHECVVGSEMRNLRRQTDCRNDHCDVDGRAIGQHAPVAALIVALSENGVAGARRSNGNARVD